MMQRFVQLALDLFDAPATAAHESERKRPPTANGQAPTAPDQAPVAPKTIVQRPAAPAVPLPSLLSPAEFRHPQANREVLLGDAVVAYALQRARRRSIGFSVGPDGLSVRAPSWVTLGDIDNALQQKGDWILRKLVEQRERAKRTQAARVHWGDGCSLPYLGEPLTLADLIVRQRGVKGGALVQTPGGARELHVGLARSAAPAQIRDAVQAWLMRDARRHFTERLDHFAPLLGVRWASLRLSSANTRWGSAKADGSIRLNWRLLHYRPAIIDYVVAHELAHLRVMDHSPRFWDTVGEVLPDWQQRRRQLRALEL